MVDTFHTTATQASPALPDTMSLSEIAERMGVSYTTVYELARTDRLPVPVFRVGRQYRLSRRAYEALMNAQHGSQASQTA